MDILLLLLIGTAASIIGALIGIGGGVIIVPSLIFLANNTEIIGDMSVQNAIGTSSLTLVFTGLFSMLAYGRSKTVDLKSGMLFSIGIVPGSLAGAYLSRFLDQDSFGIIFGAFLLLIFMVLTFKTRMIRNREAADQDKKEFKPLLGITASFFVGISAGLFGIGGGALMTPLMIIVLNFSPHVAVATSMVIIFSSSLSSSAGHFAQGNILWGYGAVLIAATYMGSKIGVRINQALNSHSLSQVLRFGLLILGIYMIIDGLM
ncbi:membrane protein [Salinicoccus sediminis]|uniref:Probable membrane transporter protein n=1 Tax=Salinicoccus sediminis TaxID=1432562 RepID=A0A0M2SPP3_9STAP|nr:sulfite exporter TauE/SafE family protein [Salinicoccus sediminis]KKK34585.1 membrane protein [Salinicoccus sediminis]